MENIQSSYFIRCLFLKIYKFRKKILQRRTIFEKNLHFINN